MLIVWSHLRLCITYSKHVIATGYDSKKKTLTAPKANFRCFQHWQVLASCHDSFWLYQGFQCFFFSSFGFSHCCLKRRWSAKQMPDNDWRLSGLHFGDCRCRCRRRRRRRCRFVLLTPKQQPLQQHPLPTFSAYGLWWQWLNGSKSHPLAVISRALKLLPLPPVLTSWESPAAPRVQFSLNACGNFDKKWALVIVCKCCDISWMCQWH